MSTFGEDDPFKIYDELFKHLEDKYGPLDDRVLSSPMMMFGISFCMREKDGLYVTYEPYHLIETESKEGLRFALFVVSDAPQEALTDMLAGLADWFLEHKLGHGDTADLSGFELNDLPTDEVKFHLFSQHPDGYGLYEVRFVDGGGSA